MDILSYMEICREISFTHIFSFICNLTLDGICYTFGVFLVPLMEYFEVKEKGPISMIGGTIMSRNENELVCTHENYIGNWHAMVAQWS